MKKIRYLYLNKSAAKMGKAFFITFIIISFMIIPCRNYADDDIDELLFGEEINLEEAKLEELRFYVDETQTLSVSNPKRIAIGNPDIIDVINVTKTELTLAPKAPGKTTLIIWDDLGEQPYMVKVVAERLNDVKRSIDNILHKLNLEEINTEIAEDEGKVLLIGRVKQEEEIEAIQTALEELNLTEKTLNLIKIEEEEAVVEIDVQVLELSKDATKTLGFIIPSNVTVTDASSNPAVDSELGATAFKGLFRFSNLYRNVFQWKLDALVEEGKARILSRPRLTCQSGKEADLLVGGEKPIMTTQVAGFGVEETTVEYKEYGIKLNIKPTVTEENQIKLALKIEVKEVGTVETLGSADAPSARAYPFTISNASTELFLNNEQTLIIGGLIKQKREEDAKKTFFLGDIPILGLFFRHKTSKIGGGAGERGDKELFITLTPTIVAGKKEKSLAEKGTAAQLKSSVSFSKDLSGATSEVERYALIIQRRILENVIYPETAKEAGFEGIVKLSLLLSYQGELLDVVVKDSSGYRVIDDSAISSVKSLSPYPPFPSSITSKELSIEVPIEYRLD